MSIPVSIEHIRGETHRHHNFDFHAINMNHGDINYHAYLDGIVYDDIKKLKKTTKIGRVVTKIHDVITQISNYQVMNGPYNPDSQTWNYILRNIKKLFCKH